MIIGTLDPALAFAGGLQASGLSLCILTPGPAAAVAETGVNVLFAGGRDFRVEGHFGAYVVKLLGEDGEIDLGAVLDRDQRAFDLVVDLREPPGLSYQLLPLGYYAPGADPQACARVQDELPEMRGEFSKPKYFNYDPSICAHGNSGVPGCRRCLDTCPTGAITSLVDRIQVDPYLCQGGGSCATACPSGALVYSYPRPRDLLNRLRVLLTTYREHCGCAPILLFHDGDQGRKLMERAAAGLDGRLIAVEVEEIGSVGPEVWLAALCFGAQRVLLLDVPTVPASVRAELDVQLQFVQALLTGLGYPKTSVARVEGPSAGESESGGMPDLGRAAFAGSNVKRDVLFLALDHLATQSDCAEPALALPDTAPLGEVLVDRQACTLCMACVSVCPAAALGDGVDRPVLTFIERNCVQCGLCRRACPESAIELRARLSLQRPVRNAARVLNEEPPFCCVACGTPFATRSVIERMTDKLRTHSMFQSDTALRRLQMCGDCRVKDMFAADTDDSAG